MNKGTHLNLTCCNFAPLFYYCPQHLLLSFQYITVQLASIHQYDQFLAALSVLFPSATDISPPCPLSLYGL